MKKNKGSAANAVAPSHGGPAAGAFPIVGIGASAGGLEAFRRLVGALPADTGMAFVLVQHLDPTHDSILAKLLSEAAHMPVDEVVSDVRVEPNHVYVTPPTSSLALVGELLTLVPRPPPGVVSLPIDSFLRTLAEVRGSQSVAVILSGTGADGTLGVQALEAAGGIVFAQEPASAKQGEMPRSAIETGVVDFVLTPEEIGRELARLGRHPYLSERPASAVGDHPAPEVMEVDAEGVALARVLALLHKASGTDFSAYRKTTLRRRIARRMAVRHVTTLAEYAQHLETDATEGAALFDDCLISVTSFFRDPSVFQALSEQVIPALLSDRPSGAPLRVWVAGCATGEEVYSLAICLLERCAELEQDHSLHIFATDLSERALSRAREGKYPETIARDVSPERLRRFFTKVGSSYQINKSVRELCVFARHDLTRDAPYSRIDLISCRNVLIYLEPRLQETLFATFHFALRPGGVLVVGPAETAGASSAFFSPLDEPRRIYARRASTEPSRFLSLMGEAGPSRMGDAQRAARALGPADLARELDRALLARFAPAGVLVSDDLRVLEFRGDTAPFLEHQGKASLDLEGLVRRGLLIDLRHAIDEARLTEAPARREELKVQFHGQLQRVNVEVIPLPAVAGRERCFFVLFENTVAPAEPTARGSASADVSQDRELVRLRRELAESTEYLHALVREHDSALEELQSTNEEALSSNQEMQSVNEELQTAKEEIQSANEELATLNQELHDRNRQLARSNEEIRRALDGANALVETVRKPLVILDGELRIEKANAAFYEAFAATAELSHGRSLAQLGRGEWNQPVVLRALEGVLAEGGKVENLEVEADFPELGRRTMSLSARRFFEGDERRLLLLGIEDRTEAKREELRRQKLLALEHDARERAEAADHLKDQFVATVSHELRGPLNVISGWANILRGAGPSPDPATLAKALAAIGRGVSAQGRLLSDLLDHSLVVTGRLRLQRGPVDMLAVAHAALEGVRAAAEAKDIRLELSGDRAASIVLGDFDRLQQVLWNLFFNAVKFTPTKGRVHITVGRVGNQAHVTVEDSGRGIAAEFLPHVFDRFRQAEGSSSRSEHGLGLGLTLVRELVELHGGTVLAESKGLNEGATFTVVLPIPALLFEPTDLALPITELAESSAGLEPAPDLLAGFSILVVDDEADARDAIVGALERYGAHVRQAGSVAEAMAAFVAARPDLLVSDLGMPGEDGYELIRRVRLLPASAGGSLPSIAVSAYGTEEHRRKVTRTGFQLHLEKPVAPSLLVTEVARLCRGQRGGAAGRGPIAEVLA